jgi:hypothetical protein
VSLDASTSKVSTSLPASILCLHDPFIYLTSRAIHKTGWTGCRTLSRPLMLDVAALCISISAEEQSPQIGHKPFVADATAWDAKEQTRLSKRSSDDLS